LDREHRTFIFLDILGRRDHRIYGSLYIWILVFDSTNLDVAGVGYLIAKFLEEYLTDDLLDAELRGLIGVVVTCIEVGSLREMGHDPIDEFSKSCLMDRVDAVVDIATEISFLEVLLGLDADHWLFRKAQHFVNTSVLSTSWTSRIDESEYHVSLTQCPECLTIDAFVDRSGFL
jgi:hypothetical protein